MGWLLAAAISRCVQVSGCHGYMPASSDAAQRSEHRPPAHTPLCAQHLQSQQYAFALLIALSMRCYRHVAIVLRRLSERM